VAAVLVRREEKVDVAREILVLSLLNQSDRFVAISDARVSITFLFVGNRSPNVTVRIIRQTSDRLGVILDGLLYLARVS
jgi:hypothetical protein